MKALIGRNYERNLLNKLVENEQSEFIALYGRRRVGKTFLIKQHFENKFSFYFSGIANSNTQKQLLSFNLAINNFANEHTEYADNWMIAMSQLIKYLEKSTDKNKVVFIDEMPWLDTKGSDFMAAIDFFWNTWASGRKDIKLIVCGSAASWIINKLLNNKGGLHNRVTSRIKIEPFTLAECEEYFKTKNYILPRYQIIQLYMAMGGIPFYLEQVENGLSAVQNINKLCFTNTGLLRNEFDNLYASLFKKPEKYIAIIEAIATKQKGLTRDEIIIISGIANGGTATKIIKELEESNFIRKYTPFEKKTKNALYQLVDFYSLFYLRFIKNSSNADENFWLNAIDSPAIRAWSGYAYEQVCMWHLSSLKKALGISGVQTRTSSWVSTRKDNAAQIDLLIDRADGVINICEIKFANNDYIITKQYEKEIRNKIGVFKSETNTKKAVHFVMFTTFGLVNNSYAMAVVQKDFDMDILFGAEG